MSVIQYYYTLKDDHHNKSTNHLSPYKVFIIFLAVMGNISMLHIILMNYLFYKWKFMSLILPHLLHSILSPTPIFYAYMYHLFSVSVSVFLFCLFFF